MEEKKDNKFFNLTSRMRISESDAKLISSAEKAGDDKKLSAALITLDKKQAGVELKDIKGINEKVINYSAHTITEVSPLSLSEYLTTLNPSIFSSLFDSNELSCDCVIPFTFDRMRKNGEISGPEMTEVTRGIIGAMRYYSNEYRVYNSGDTEGKGRVHKVGSLDILFSATIPVDGRYCLLLPYGNLWINGKSRVLGHGNFTTCYDSKIWVDYFSILHLSGTIIEASHSDIHYDGTRSEDRTRYFHTNISLKPRYLFFNANAGQDIELILRLQIDTAANEDGKTWGWVDSFGLPANLKTDYDTMIIKS